MLSDWDISNELTESYNIMLRLTNSPNTIKFQNNVQFNNGIGIINWNEMTIIN